MNMNKIKIPTILKNKYVITLILFLGLIFFFDPSGVPVWVSQISDNKQIKKETEKYDAMSTELERQAKVLRTNRDSLEKYARENFYMKKENEKIFIIE